MRFFNHLKKKFKYGFLNPEKKKFKCDFLNTQTKKIVMRFYKHLENKNSSAVL